MAAPLESVRALLAAGGIDVLVSDLDGVLRHVDPGLWERLDAATGTASGSSFAAILGNPMLADVTRGRAAHAQWREDAVARMQEAGAAPEAARNAVATWADTAAVVDEDVLALLRDARGQGLAVFVFTNGTDRVPQELRLLGLQELTGADDAHLINSAQLGAAKPEPASFARAHRQIEARLGRGVPAGAVLFLDDSAANVEGAQVFGWTAERYRRDSV